MASNEKNREVMNAAIALLGKLDKQGISKVESLMIGFRGRANKRGAINAALAKTRSLKVSP